MKEYLILVDKHDQEIGTEEKLKVHQNGLLHRAFSIFIFNDQKKLLLQKRALTKYHSGGLWTNTCCGHPKLNEKIQDASIRRLNEEMGLTTNLIPIGNFHYKKSIPLSHHEKPLIENEIDHVFYGFSDQTPHPNPHEVCDYCWITIDEIKHLQTVTPETFTSWFFMAFDHLINNSNLFS